MNTEDRAERLESLESLIKQQILFCEAGIFATRKIYKFIEENRPQDLKDIKAQFGYDNHTYINFLRYTAQLYIADSILILSTLLESRGFTKEQSISSYLVKSEERNDQFLRIIADFEKTGLRDIRNQYIAHKDPRMFTDAHGKIFGTFKQGKIDSAMNILEDVKTFVGTLFIPLANNYIWAKLEPAIDQILANINRDLSDYNQSIKKTNT